MPAPLTLIRDDACAEAVLRRDAWEVGAALAADAAAGTQYRPRGLAATAISALDCALWDVKAKLLDVPLVRLLGAMRERVPTLRERRLHHLHRHADPATSSHAGSTTMDAAGSRSRSAPSLSMIRIACARRARRSATSWPLRRRQWRASPQSRRCTMPQCFAEYGVEWFEEPVSSDDTAGLASLRSALPAAYGDRCGRIRLHTRLFPPAAGRATPSTCCRPISSRCGGITGFLRRGDALRRVSRAAVRALRTRVASCMSRAPRRASFIRNGFTITCASKRMLFDGAPRAHDGAIAPDLARPGCGLEFKYRRRAAICACEGAAMSVR